MNFDCKRILVINVTRIGDTLMTTPLLRALATAWPGAEITFAGHRKRIEVMQNIAFIQHVRAISKRVAPFLGRFGGQSFDLAIVFGNDVSLIEYAFRVSRRVVADRQTAAAINDRLFAIANDDDFPILHAMMLTLRAIRPLGLNPAGFHLSYVVTPAENDWAQRTLNGVSCQGRPRFGLQLASFPTKSHRDWPVGHFVELCLRIRQDYPDAHFLIFGGPSDVKRAAEVADRLQHNVTIFAGRLTLRQTGALMNNLDLYIGVDTGPTHIMGALHRPLVALYHPTAPVRALCPFEHPCFYGVDHSLADKGATFDTPMAEISVEQVWLQVQAALSGNAPPAPRLPYWPPLTPTPSGE